MANHKVAIDDIADAIADELKPLRAERSRAEVEQSVREQLEEWRGVLSPRYSREAIWKNRRHVIKLREAIRRLLREISVAPRPVQISMFSGMSGPYAPQTFLVDLKKIEHRLAAADISCARDGIKKFSGEAACNFFFSYSKKAPPAAAPKARCELLPGIFMSI